MGAPPTRRALEIHDAACGRGEAGYIDPVSGLFAMTAVYLRDRGFCCGKGCRHCPWPPSVRAAAGRPAARPAWPGRWAVPEDQSGS